VVNTWGIFKAF